MEIQEKAKKLWHPNAKLAVVVEFNSFNSPIAKKLKVIDRQTYIMRGLEDKGVLIGVIGHLQLIEWLYIADIY